MVIRKLQNANRNYFPSGSKEVNGFIADSFDPTYFSIENTLGTPMQHPLTAAIVGHMMQVSGASRGDAASVAANNAILARLMAK